MRRWLNDGDVLWWLTAGLLLFAVASLPMLAALIYLAATGSL